MGSYTMVKKDEVHGSGEGREGGGGLRLSVSLAGRGIRVGDGVFEWGLMPSALLVMCESKEKRLFTGRN